jgi:hypothetical protein
MNKTTTFNPYFFPGLPEMLDEAALSNEVSLARAETRPRTTPSQPEEAGTRPSQLSDADIDTLRARFPILA